MSPDPETHPDSATGRLPLPGVVDWPNFPFEGDLRVREVAPFDDHEEPRDGDPGGKPCIGCAHDDDAYLWTTPRWRLKTLAPFSPLPISWILETRAHIDMNEFDDEHAAELGLLTVRLTKFGESLPSIGRVHTYRWGDGATHFHIWFLGRPFGAHQLRGLTMPIWGLTLPPLDSAITDPINAGVAEELADWTGG